MPGSLVLIILSNYRLREVYPDDTKAAILEARFREIEVKKN